MAQDAPVIGRGEPELIRTALCVEPRNGLIHVFLPPLTAAEDWLALIAAVEDTAAETGRKPTYGTLRLDYTVINQKDEDVMRFRMVLLARRRPEEV